jgi:hypothetical protein
MVVAGTCQEKQITRLVILQNQSNARLDVVWGEIGYLPHHNTFELSANECTRFEQKTLLLPSSLR